MVDQVEAVVVGHHRGDEVGPAVAVGTSLAAVRTGDHHLVPAVRMGEDTSSLAEVIHTAADLIIMVDRVMGANTIMAMGDTVGMGVRT